MKRILSSPLTFFWKFIATPLLIIGCSVYLLARGRTDEGKNPDETPVGDRTMGSTVLFVTAAGVYFLWLTAGLKRVAVDDDALYISNYRTEIRVPLTQVAEVRESGSRRSLEITIDLRHLTALGQRIVFLPRLRLYWSGLHPVVRELRVLVERARERQGWEAMPAQPMSARHQAK